MKSEVLDKGSSSGDRHNGELHPGRQRRYRLSLGRIYRLEERKLAVGEAVDAPDDDECGRDVEERFKQGSSFFGNARELGSHANFIGYKAVGL
jgi:hypothetical protein